MNYFKIYQDIIEKSQNRNLEDGEYYEKHHIIPKSIFKFSYCEDIFKKYYMENIKKNSKQNIIKLTLREHYISHLLLVRIFENNKNCYIRMIYAANFLTNRTKNSKDYAWQKIEYLKVLSESMKNKPSRAKGKKWSEESKRNKSGENHVMYGKTYEELYGIKKAKKLKIARKNGRLGKKWTNESKDKMRNRHFSNETREKISKSKKGKPISETTKKKISIFFSNPDLNPNVDQTLYKFHHKDGRNIISRKYEMKKKYKCSDIHKLIRGDRKSCKGWYYDGEIVN
jgi:hypothetical protein